MTILSPNILPLRRPKIFNESNDTRGYFDLLENYLRQLEKKVGSSEGSTIGDIGDISPADGTFMVGNGTEWEGQTSDEARSTLNVYSTAQVYTKSEAIALIAAGDAATLEQSKRYAYYL